MSRRKIRFTSIAALVAHAASGAKMMNRHRILQHLHEESPCSRVQISKSTGIPLNEVCGRVNELLKENIVTDGGAPIVCPVTGNVVHAVRLEPTYSGNAY